MNHNWYAVITAPVLLSKELTDKQKLLIALLSNLSNEKGFCFASNKYLGDCLGCSERTIQQNLSHLETKKLIGRTIKINDKKEVEYRAIMVTTDNLTPPEENCTTSRSQLHHNNNSLFSSIDKELNLPITNNKNSREKKFEDFWNQYDYKKDREKARRAFIKLSEPEVDKAMGAVASYVKTRNPKFIKHASTWLNGKCWEDEYETVKHEELSKDDPYHPDNFYNQF